MIYSLVNASLAVAQQLAVSELIINQSRNKAATKQWESTRANKIRKT